MPALWTGICLSRWKGLRLNIMRNPVAVDAANRVPSGEILTSVTCPRVEENILQWQCSDEKSAVYSRVKMRILVPETPTMMFCWML